MVIHDVTRAHSLVSKTPPRLNSKTARNGSQKVDDWPSLMGASKYSYPLIADAANKAAPATNRVIRWTKSSSWLHFRGIGIWDAKVESKYIRQICATVFK